jgi:6-phosphogluconolactonase (cycloisomerase 2 family)
MKKICIFPVITLALGLAQTGHASEKKAVFVMTNDAKENHVLSYTVQADGSLKAFGSFATGGRGSGGTTDPLGSQGSLTLSSDHSLLFAVNEGSGEVSAFLVDGPKLVLADKKPTGGSAPVAVAEHDGLVYVVNFAGNSSVVGFKVDDGNLNPIAGSRTFLTTSNSGASSLAFSSSGDFLIVTEKLTNNIDVFPVMPNGTLGPIMPMKDPSAGLFEVAFAPEGALLALHAGSGIISSFLLGPTGTLTSLSTVPTLGGASCWFAVTPNGNAAYTSNPGSTNISGFAITGAGLLSPVVPSTIVGTLPAGSTNLDIAVSGDSKYVYTLDSGSGTIGMFAIQKDGTLGLIGTVPAVTAVSGANGIAAL